MNKIESNKKSSLNEFNLLNFNNNHKILNIFLIVYVVCRRGNDSQIAVEMLNQYFSSDSNNNVNLNCIKDIIGGLQEWANKIDSNFPKY